MGVGAISKETRQLIADRRRNIRLHSNASVIFTPKLEFPVLTLRFQPLHRPTISLCKGFSRYWSTVFPAAPGGAGLHLIGTQRPELPFFRTVPQTLLPAPQRSGISFAKQSGLKSFLLEATRPLSPSEFDFNPLSPRNSDRWVQITRAELYEKVWSTPMVRIAKGLAFSDRGLAKVCARLEVPVPPRGHWAKLRPANRLLRFLFLPQSR